MYESFYKFRGKPFQLSPEHRMFFQSHGHKRALSYLLYGVKQGEGFIVITGDVGTGKTTLVNTLAGSLEDQRIVTANIVTTQIQAEDLLRVVAAEFGLSYEHDSKAVLLKNLENFFRQLAHEGKRALLLVDEAQNLPQRSVEELRMLSNFQLGGRALLQSFMLGQKEFRNIMRSEAFEQLRQRVIAAYHLRPLSAEETRGYVEYRLQVVGWNNDPALRTEVFDAIHQFTNGVPRRINVFCDRMMLCASLEEKHEIDGQLVETVARDMDEEELGGREYNDGQDVSVTVQNQSAVDDTIASVNHERLSALEREIALLRKVIVDRAEMEKRIGHLNDSQSEQDIKSNSQGLI